MNQVVDNPTHFSTLSTDEAHRELLALILESSPAETIRHLNWLLADWMALCAKHHVPIDLTTLSDMTYHTTRVVTFLSRMQEVLPT